MNDPTLDQLRVFVAVAETKSFSAAGRSIGRVQSAITYTIRRLEEALGVPLFEGGRRQRLTPAGGALLPEAHTVLERADRLVGKAAAISAAREPSISLVVDALFPMAALVGVAQRFEAAFPTVSLTLHVEALESVVERLRAKDAQLAVSSPSGLRSASARGDAFDAEHLFEVPMCAVTGRGHPLATYPGPIPGHVLRDHRQIVLSSREPGEARVGILSRNTWQTLELATKHALLRGGLGWGRMPLHTVEQDLARGDLVELQVAQWGRRPPPVKLLVVYPAAAPPGPVGRWLVEQLSACAPAEDSARPP